MSDDHLALAVALHAERTEANSLHVDCWACEAARSKAIADLLTELRRAQSALGATEAVLARAVPEEDTLLDLWREFWRERLADMPRAASSGRPVTDVSLPPGRPNS